MIPRQPARQLVPVARVLLLVQAAGLGLLVRPPLLSRLHFSFTFLHRSGVRGLQLLRLRPCRAKIPTGWFV